MRAEISARDILGYTLIEMADLAAAKEQLEHALASARQLGTRRFEPIGLSCLAWIAAEGDEASTARGLAEEAVETARETGPTFAGP